MAGHSKFRRLVERESEAAALLDISQKIKSALDIFGVSPNHILT